jgi:hypothetical protein
MTEKIKDARIIYRPTYIEVDLDRIAHNQRILMSVTAPGAKPWPRQG